MRVLDEKEDRSSCRPAVDNAGEHTESCQAEWGFIRWQLVRAGPSHPVSAGGGSAQDATEKETLLTGLRDCVGQAAVPLPRVLPAS